MYTYSVGHARTLQLFSFIITYTCVHYTHVYTIHMYTLYTCIHYTHVYTIQYVKLLHNKCITIIQCTGYFICTCTCKDIALFSIHVHVPLTCYWMDLL